MTDFRITSYNVCYTKLLRDYKESKSSAFFVPVGVTAEYAWKGNVFTATVMGGFHQLKFDDDQTEDPKSMSIMLGVRL